MKLIVGLGNPGIFYSHTRHNIGFMVVKALAKAKKVALKRGKDVSALEGKAGFDTGEAILALPLTFMNLSGGAVKALLKKYRVEIEDLLVVCDDLDLEFGRLKIKSGGSSAGHRGVESIVERIESREFGRLRIGIGRPFEGADSARYVLSPFARKEREKLKSIIEEAVECCQAWVKQGQSAAMNTFNKRSIGNE